MIWLYWRRSRKAIGAAGLVLGALAALLLVASALADGKRSGQTAPAAVRGDSATSRASRPPSADDPLVQRGLLLMAAAVTACRTVPYHGVQIVAWSGPVGSSSYLLDVWHRPGGPELAHDDGDADDVSAARLPGAAPAGGTVGVLSLSQAMLHLLRVNYVLEYQGTGTSSDRPAQIVAVRRHDGSLAARYWLDRATGLPLRREMFDATGHRVSEGAFIDLQIGQEDDNLIPAAEGQAWSSYLRPSQMPSDGRLAALHDHGWPVPARLAGNMVLTRVTRTATPTGQVLDASYSDGLSVVSVFMQRGALPETLPGWRHGELDGVHVLLTRAGGLDEQGLAWSAHGLVFTVVADAPPTAITQVIDQLPHQLGGGFWSRVGRGLERIASWFDPFG